VIDHPQAEPFVEQHPRSGAPVHGVILGALGAVPLLGPIFSLLGLVTSLHALCSLRRRSRPTAVACLGLAVSLLTLVPGVLVWAWSFGSAAAW
jgi:hypothetical protein